MVINDKCNLNPQSFPLPRGRCRMRGKASVGKCTQVQTSAGKCNQVAYKTWGHADAQSQLNLYVRLPYAVAGYQKCPNRNS